MCLVGSWVAYFLAQYTEQREFPPMSSSVPAVALNIVPAHHRDRFNARF